MNAKRILGLMLCLALALGALACKKEEPTPVAPPAPTAQEYYDQGLAYYQDEDYASASQQFELATQTSPSMIEAWYYLGMSYAKQNKREKAKAALEECVKLDASFKPAREALGIFFFFDRDYARAKPHLEAARALGSIDPNVYYYLGKIYLFENNCKDDIAMFTRTLELDSNYLPAKDDLARAPSPRPRPSRASRRSSRAAPRPSTRPTSNPARGKP